MQKFLTAKSLHYMVLAGLVVSSNDWKSGLQHGTSCDYNTAKSMTYSYRTHTVYRNIYGHVKNKI